MSDIPRGQTEKRRAYMKAYAAAHPKDKSAYKAAYDASHREQNAAYRAANKEKRSAAAAARYQANRETILAKVKAYADANKGKILAYQADYYQKNPEKVKANVAAYRMAFPEKKAHLENKRRARKFSNGGSHTLEEITEKFASLGDVCFYCGKGGSLSVDHDLPLSRGGTDAIENILPACRSCNSKKNAMTALEYLEKLSCINRG